MSSKPTHRADFDSLGAMIDQAASDKPAKWEDRSSRSTSQSDWYGSRNFASAVVMAREGWREGREKMVRAVSVAATGGAMQAAPYYTMDVAGAYPNAAMAAAGEPMCMVNFAPSAERSKPIVRLAIAGSVSAGIKPEQIFNYGAGLLAFIDGLEQSDVRTELTMAYVQQSYGKDRGVITVRIKAAEEALDLDRAAFAIASPAMFRRLGFSILEQEFPQSFEAGYGTPSDPVHGVDLDEGMTILPSVQSFIRKGDVSTPAKAFATMAPTIEALLRDRFADFPPLCFTPS